MPQHTIPEAVRNRAIANGNEAWITQLPELIADLEREWGITVSDNYEGGTEAFVARATLADGTPAALKLLLPHPDGTPTYEMTALRLADGNGCVRLLRDDPERHALLLERLGRSLDQLALPIQQRHEILCATALRLWRPAPDAGLPTGAKKARWLIDYITDSWEQLGRPCTEQAVHYALACAERRLRAHDDERAVLVHGDVHQWNTLEASDGSGADGNFKLVDPDGLLAEAEYDIGIVMREDPQELLAGDPHDRARWLAHRTGLDATAIWEWGVVERLSTGLACLSINLEPPGRLMLHAADEVARRPFP